MLEVSFLLTSTPFFLAATVFPIVSFFKEFAASEIFEDFEVVPDFLGLS